MKIRLLASDARFQLDAAVFNVHRIFDIAATLVSKILCFFPDEVLEVLQARRPRSLSRLGACLDELLV